MRARQHAQDHRRLAARTPLADPPEAVRGTLLAHDRAGLDAITLADIAAVAGIGRTAVYNYFPDKEEILLAFISHQTQQYLERLEHVLVGVDDPIDQLRTYVRQQTDLKKVFHLAGSPDLRAMLSRETQRRLREHVVGVDEILRRILTSGIESGSFPTQDLDTTVPLVHACLSGRGLPDDVTDRERAIDATETFVLRAVGAQVPTLA